MITVDDWEAWFDGHGPALTLFARQWTESRADAEDVVQEAFIRFWRTGRQRAADPLAYLFASVKRAAQELHRSRKRRQRREEAVGRDRPESELFRTDLEQDEWRRQVERLLADLPEEQREVLVMKIWGKLTFPQIAAALDIPSNTAAGRYRYALSALRKELDPVR